MSRDPSLTKASKILAEIEALLAATESAELTTPARKKLVSSVDAMRDRLERLTRKIDPNELPDAFFDPAEPSLIGNFVALAMVAQDRKPLGSLTRFYGSGVYAIYYTGPNPLYAPISGTEMRPSGRTGTLTLNSGLRQTATCSWSSTPIR